MILVAREGSATVKKIHCSNHGIFLGNLGKLGLSHGLVTQVLMLIHFLQRRDPPILPSLQVPGLSPSPLTSSANVVLSQDIAFSQNEKARYVNGVDCRFCTDAAKIEKEMAYLRGSRELNKDWFYSCMFHLRLHGLDCRFLGS